MGSLADETFRRDCYRKTDGYVRLSITVFTLCSERNAFL